MRIKNYFFIFLIFFVFCKFENARGIGQQSYKDMALQTAVTTVVKDPISLLTKDVYDNIFKKNFVKLIRKLKKVLRYRKILRWARIWWILLVREIVGDDGVLEKRTNNVLREMWEQCAIAVYNNMLNSVESKPVLTLHAILTECKHHYASKLKTDADLIVPKIDKILKSELFRFWVAKEYLKLGRSNRLYFTIKPKDVPHIPEVYTLKYLAKYMENKLHSIDSKKNLASKNYKISVESTSAGDGDSY